MRNLLLAVLMLIPASTMAGPKRILTAVPRAVGRSYANMVTFRRPYLAAEQWAVLGAVIFDQKTTLDQFHHCPTCVETNPLSPAHNRQYGLGGAILFTAVAFTHYTTTMGYGDELLRGDKSEFWSHINYALAPAFIAIHATAGASNMRLSTGAPPPCQNTFRPEITIACPVNHATEGAHNISVGR